jgi:phthiodiolone/phenolphthiodiolone dimycocerosates ketoreductase
LVKPNQLRFSFSVGNPSVKGMIGEGLLGERLGFDFVWFSDHLTDLPPFGDIADPWTSLAYLSSRTKRIMLAAGVTDALRIHPAKTAHIVATLNHLSGGRAILGLGAGEVMNTKPYGISWEPAQTRIHRLREYIHVVHRLWSSSFEHPANYTGKYYSLNKAHLALQPIQKPSIYIGSFSSTKMLEIVGELGDGWFPGALYTPKSYDDQIKIINQSAKRVQRNRDKIDLIANIPIILEKDSSIRKHVKTKLKKFLFLNKYMLKILGANDLYESISRDLQFQLITSTPEYASILEKKVNALRIPEDILEKCMDEMMAVGSVDQILSKIEKFVRAGSTHVYVGYFMATRETYKFVSKKIMPYFTVK